MNKKYLIIAVLSSLTLAGAGYFVYTKIKISKLNKNVTSLDETISLIDSIDTTNVDPSAYEPVEPTLPPASDDFSK